MPTQELLYSLLLVAKELCVTKTDVTYGKGTDRNNNWQQVQLQKGTLEFRQRQLAKQPHAFLICRVQRSLWPPGS